MVNYSLTDSSIDMFLAILPEGEENAIRRDDLTKVCVDMGLINSKCKDKDRAMRKLLQRARLSSSIISRPNGGYYKPNKDELENIIKHRQREMKRARTTFMSVKYDGLLSEDLAKGRI